MEEDAEGSVHSGSEGPEDVVDDDEFDDIADRFESSYNFRFEEPCVRTFFIKIILAKALHGIQRRRPDCKVSS